MARISKSYRAAKHREAVLCTCIHMDRSVSMQIPRLWTDFTRATGMPANSKAADGSWWCRRHHSASVLSGFSCSSLDVMNTFGDRQWKCVDSRWYMSHKLVYHYSLSIQVQWQPSPWLSIRWIRSIIYPAMPPVEAAPVVTYLRFQFRSAARAAPVRWPCPPCSATAPAPCSAHFDHAHFHHSPKTSRFSYSIDFEVDWPQ